MSRKFYISDTNPNEEVGGGGCLCQEQKHEDQTSPYIIFPATSTDSNISPHTVLCQGCACDAGALELEESVDGEEVVDL